VVDDGSNDGTKQILQEKYPETTCNTPKRLNNLKVENSIIKQQGVFYGRIKI
jgi:glycosyltransferase involved in cell wall biosynthesis